MLAGGEIRGQETQLTTVAANELQVALECWSERK